MKAALKASIGAAPDADALAMRLFAALGDRELAADASLPRTGIALARERQLSAAFIRIPEAAYGTRCSTLIITERLGRQPITHVYERSFNPSGAVALLRRASLRNWPPRYAQDAPGGAVDVGEVVESEAAPALTSERPVPESAAVRPRVRSLLKPAAPKRRKRRVAETA